MLFYHTVHKYTHPHPQTTHTHTHTHTHTQNIWDFATSFLRGSLVQLVIFDPRQSAVPAAYKDIVMVDQKPLDILWQLVLYHLAGIVSNLATHVGRGFLLGLENLGLSCQGQQFW